MEKENALENTDIYKNLPLLVVIKKPDLTFVEANDRWLKAAHFKSNDAILGKSDVDCPWAQFTSLYKQHETDALSGNVYSTIQPTFIEEGKFCWIHNYKFPQFDKDGNPSRLIVTAYTIENPKLLNELNSLHAFDKKRFSGHQYYSNKTKHEALSEKQMKILFLLLRGKSVKEISGILNLAKSTVDYHIDNIKETLNCHTKSQLIDKAVAEGYVNIIPGAQFFNKS